MRKCLFIFIALLFLVSFWGTPAHAQFVNVSGTVIDVNGLHYSNGSIQAQIIPLGISPTINNLPFTGFVSGSLDINGSFSINLADNNVVKPAGTQWQITISGTAGIPPWIGLGTQTFVKVVTITTGGGACVVVGSLPCDISSTLNPAPQLARIFSGPGGGITCSPGPCNSNYIALFNNNTTVTDSLCAIFNGVLVCATPMDVQNNGYGIEKLNSASGTACGLSVSFDAAGNAITTADGATVGSEGVAVTLQPGTNASGQPVGCGTSGNVFIGQLGSFSLTFDNQTVIRDYVTIGANGQFHDAGATQPTGVQVIGRVTSLNSGSGTNATADIFTGDTVGNNASKGGKGTLCEINGVNAPGQDCNFNDTVPAAGSNKINVRWQTDNGNPDTNVSAEIDVAQAAIPGALELNTDLCGTFSAPQVCGFHAHPYTETSLATKDVICASSSTSYANCKAGVIPRLIVATTDTVLPSDRGGWLLADGTVLAETLPTAASLGGSNFYFNMTANGSGSITLTASGSETITVNGASATPASSATITAGEWCNFTSDTAGTAHWYGTCSSSVPTSTQTKRMAFPMADNNAGTCSPSWDLPASNAAVLTPKTDGTNGTVQCTLAYADGQIAYQTALPAVPADWQSWATATITFTTSDTTNGHTISFALALACVNPNAGLTDTPAYGADNTFATVTIGGGAVANATYQAQTGNLTGGSCAAGTLPHFRLKRLTDTATDTAVAVTGAIEIDYIGNGAGGAAPGTVSSVFGRTGPVVAANGDYSFANLSGLLGCAQLPTFTGAVTNSGCAMSLAGGAVSSITGDGILLNNSGSTGAVTLTRPSISANKVYAGPASGGSSNLVQHNSGHTGSGILSVAYTSNNTASDLLVACANNQSAAFGVLTDTSGNTWISDVQQQFGNAQAIWHVQSAIGGANTVSLSNVGSDKSLHIYEFSGQAGSAFDVSGVSNGTAATLTTTTSGSVASANEIVMACGQNLLGTGTTAVTLNGAYTTVEQTFDNAVQAIALGSGIGNATTGLSGTQSVTFSANGTPNFWNGIIATYKLASTGSGAGSIRSLVCADLPAHSPCNVFSADFSAQVAAITDTTMVLSGSNTNVYRLTGTINCTTTSAAAVAQLNIKYTDTANTAQTVSISDTCTALVTTGIPQEVIGIRAKSGTAITYGVAITNTPTYDVSVRLEQQ